MTKNGNHVSFDAYKNGNIKPYISLIEVLQTELLNREILSNKEFQMVTANNPLQAFKIEVCRTL
ncbi:hypothetical protein D3C85_1832930 [compost metagenome]